MRSTVDGIKKVPHSEEATKWPSRRTHRERDPMNIHEYQAKELLAKFGVAVPQGGVAYTADEAISVARRFGGAVWGVKAQIPSRGRGKAGGGRLAPSAEDGAAAGRGTLRPRAVAEQNR